MNDITPKEASEILSSYTDLGYGIVIEGDDVSKIVQALSLARKTLASGGDLISREALQGEYKTACNVLLSLEQIVRSSDGWEDSAVEAVHNAVQTAIKCMHDRPQGECKTCIHRDPEDKKCDCGALERAGCPFPVSDDYFCKFYEKGGAE